MTGYIVCAVFQCEEPPTWQEEDGTLLCELHKPDDEDNMEDNNIEPPPQATTDHLDFKCDGCGARVGQFCVGGKDNPCGNRRYKVRKANAAANPQPLPGHFEWNK